MCLYNINMRESKSKTYKLVTDNDLEFGYPPATSPVGLGCVFYMFLYNMFYVTILAYK